MTAVRRLAAAVVLAVVAALSLPGAAQAAGYQFWGFYHLTDSEWGFAAEGAATVVPEDGGVDGWRFAVSADDEIRTPRAVLEFDEICGATPAQDGMKRIGVVIDPGRAVDAPEGSTPPDPGAHCVVAAEDATSVQVLAEVVDVRTDDVGMICGVDGFPADGCSAEVADPTEEQLAPDEQIDIPVAAPTDPAPTEEEPTADEPTEENGTGDGEATEDGTGENGAEDETTDDGATEDETTDNGAEENGTEDDTATEDETTDNGAENDATEDETTDNGAGEDGTEDDAGLPGWVWLVGVVVLVAILLGLSAAARNRRLEQAGAIDSEEDTGPDGLGGEDPRYGPRDQ